MTITQSVCGKMRLKCWLLFLLGALPSVGQITIPSNTPIEIRLTERISTAETKPGSLVRGILAAPVMLGDLIVLPLGSRAEGRVIEVHRVRLGLVHETSAVGMQIDRVYLPDGTEVLLTTKIAQIEDSREVIDKRGSIVGVRSTSTLSHKASGAVGALSFSNPVALIFTTSATATLLRFSDPEITLPAGTELILLTTQPLHVKTNVDPTVPVLADSPESKQALLGLTHSQLFRTTTDHEHVPSDVTNLMFISDGDTLIRAFTAAGWVQVDSLDATSTYKTIRSISEEQSYRTAPMSTLLLGERKPTYSLAKTLDTFSKRHHLRIFATGDSWNGQPVWVSSSTQDIGIGLSANRRKFIHQIDQNIDHERTKVVNDLLLTGCVNGLNLVSRPWLPSNMKNGTGEAIATDNQMAIVRLDTCQSPLNLAPVEQRSPTDSRENILLRTTRQTNLTFRNMVLRDNIAVTAYTVAKAILEFKHPKPPTQPLAMSSILDTGKYSIASEDTHETAVATLQHRVDDAPLLSGARLQTSEPRQARFQPYSVEVGIHGGFAGFAGGNGGSVGYLFIPDDLGNKPLVLIGLGNEHSNGWNIGTSVTLDTRVHLSHEINFEYNRTGFRLEFADLELPNGPEVTDPATQKDFIFDDVILSSTEVGYNLQYHMRSRESRWRPYLSIGPSLRLMHLTEAPVTKASPWFKLGLSSVGWLTAAYHFGTTPPLEGGGIFQAGLQYGAGIKYRAWRRFLLRADYKETLTAQPDFWSKSKDDIFDASKLPGYRFEVIGPILEDKMRQQRATLGISFIF